MGFFKNLRQGLEAARNPPGQAEIEASLAQLTPQQRAAYDANMTRIAEAQVQVANAHAEAVRINDAARVLEGPAGDHLHGPAMRDVDITAMPDVGELMRQQMSGFRSALKQSFNVGGAEEVGDPAERERVSAAEREARARARAPFRAPQAVPVEVSRLATRGGTQLEELAAFLGESGLAARPERVWGVYRVADRISQALTPQSEKGRVVEWDVVHAADARGPATAAPEVTRFGAADRWVGRRAGERAVLDEDLGIAFCQGPGMGPERCLGLARYSEFRALSWGQEDEPIRTLVRGLVAVHPDAAGDTFERMRAAAPIAVPETPRDAHIEVLRWEEIASVVRPKLNHPPLVPSPFPHLPSTPLELLRSYLEVVGVAPEDSYGVQATVDGPHALEQGGFLTTNLGPKQPCADGEARMRAHGCRIVVIAYRDRPAYAEGRQRWARYQAEVLQAKLVVGAAARPVISLGDDDLAGVPTGLRTVVRVAGAIDRLADWDFGEHPPPHRYCWPPVA